MNMLATQHGKPRAAVRRMGGLMMPDERLLRALHNSRLLDKLSNSEIDILISLVTVQHFDIQELVVGLDDEPFQDALIILIKGEIEVSAMVGNEPVSLHLVSSGDLARVISFVGGDMINVSSSISIRQESTVLLLQRSRLETLLNSHPSIVCRVLLNLVLHVHGVARSRNAQGELVKNYLHGMHGHY